MKYLFIDTSFDNLIVAIISNDEIISSTNINGMETSSKIMLAIDETFKKTNLKVNDIDKIFVVTGPGSFTGIRVGLTVAKIMGYCLNKSLIALSELELLATTKTDTLLNMPIIDARRGYVYGAIYDKDLNIVYKESHILLSELKEKASNYTIIDNSSNVDIIKIIKKHEFDNPSNPHTLMPNYLKNTEAEERMNDKGM